SMISNTANILGIELLAAAQGIEFLRPMKSSGALEQVHALLRRDIPQMAHDRYLAPDMAHATQMVRDGSLARILHDLPDLPTLWVPT
ncbi:MAG: histidine ammonia-lyase, partial [Burkholderiaceae bacterium]|nr:histidine ammonia-lyase [Burkholderiaceae bacterium]